MRMLLYVLTVFECLVMGRIEAFYLQPQETPVVRHIQPISLTTRSSGLAGVDCIYVINLDARPEKWTRTKTLLEEKGLHANRVRAINGWQLSREEMQQLAGPYPVKLVGGQVGCLLSHVSILKNALDNGFQAIWILEDDVEFLLDVQWIPYLLKQLKKVDKKWDVFFTDIDMRLQDGSHQASCSYDPRPDQTIPSRKSLMKKKDVTEDIMSIRQRWCTHSYLLSRAGIQKLYSYFTHVYLWSPVDVDMHYVPDIREYASKRDVVSNSTETNVSDTVAQSSLNVRP